MIGRIRQQWIDWHEITTNDEPIIRWVPWPWSAQKMHSGKNVWPQVDLWVTPDCFLGFTIGSRTEDSYRTSALTLTLAYLSLIVSVEHWEEK